MKFYPVNVENSRHNASISNSDLSCALDEIEFRRSEVAHLRACLEAALKYRQTISTEFDDAVYALEAFMAGANTRA